MPNTRHSVGMRLIDFIATQYNIEMKMNKKCSCSIGTMTHPKNNDIELVLVKPKSFMNNCGCKIVKCSKIYQVFDHNLYLIHDELDLVVGKYKLKENGSPRGHNGVRSVHDIINNQSPPRLLVGIDRPTSRNEVADYVLNSFDNLQSKKIDEILPIAVDVLFEHILKKHRTISVES
ncbi:unnamed protein product [Dimorphilus gyrociliatus]|uniref:peptidyl-tRNA hydrolase n=1 Tax=Dimorphilus gyrociliatus TaxID=2664684 RepID=A0A7I8VJ36_9ANNE|nr:unnamed protein product [Dimorphilus gyrociliatus]